MSILLSPVSERLTTSEAETEALGRSLAAAFEGGEVVLLQGELGAGKTAFVRGMLAGLGGAPDDVASPTFVLLTRYAGRLTLHHADLYRLSGPGDDAELGLEELPGSRGVLAIEWAERLGQRPWSGPIYEVTLEHAGDDRRRVTVSGAEA